MAVNRPGRPEITKLEQDALSRIARTQDGKLFIERLARIKRRKQDDDANILDHDTSLVTKGSIQELDALMREFSEAEPGRKSHEPDRQKRF